MATASHSPSAACHIKTACGIVRVVRTRSRFLLPFALLSALAACATLIPTSRPEDSCGPGRFLFEYVECDEPPAWFAGCKLAGTMRCHQRCDLDEASVIVREVGEHHVPIRTSTSTCSNGEVCAALTFMREYDISDTVNICISLDELEAYYAR